MFSLTHYHTNRGGRLFCFLKTKIYMHGLLSVFQVQTDYNLDWSQVPQGCQCFKQRLWRYICKLTVILEVIKDCNSTADISCFSLPCLFNFSWLRRRIMSNMRGVSLFSDRLYSFSRWLNSVMHVPTTKKLQTYRTKCAASEVRGM